jgi:hypothetical protein
MRILAYAFVPALLNVLVGISTSIQKFVFSAGTYALQGLRFLQNIDLSHFSHIVTVSDISVFSFFDMLTPYKVVYIIL